MTPGSPSEGATAPPRDPRPAAPGDPIPVLFIAHRPDAVKGGQVNLLRLLERLDQARFRPTVMVARHGSISERTRALEVYPIQRFVTGVQALFEEWAGA